MTLIIAWLMASSSGSSHFSVSVVVASSCNVGDQVTCTSNTTLPREAILYNGSSVKRTLDF